jgi:hypothetical protein
MKIYRKIRVYGTLSSMSLTRLHGMVIKHNDSFCIDFHPTFKLLYILYMVEETFRFIT